MDKESNYLGDAEMAIDRNLVMRRNVAVLVRGREGAAMHVKMQPP